MRRKLSFLLKFLASLWLLLASTFLLLLLFNRPHVPELAPFAGISVNNNGSRIYLPNRIFTCVETDQNFQCKSQIYNQSLVLDLTKGKEYQYNLAACRASYNQKIIGCQKTGVNHAPILSDTYEIKNLGLNAPQMQAVKKEYWGINFLMSLSDSGLTQMSLGLSVLLGTIAAISTRLGSGKFSKILASINCGFVMCVFSWYFLIRIADVLIPVEQFSLNIMFSIFNGMAIAIGAGTSLFTAVLLLKRSNLSNLWLVGINSIGTAFVSIAFFLAILLGWGYVD